MTDKEKIREKIEKRYEYWKEKEFNSHSIESEIRMSECQYLLLMIDSLQEESEPQFKVGDTIRSKIWDRAVHEIVSMDDSAYYFENSGKVETANQDQWELAEDTVGEFLNTESMIESYKQRLISQANGVKNSPLIDMCLASYKHGINETLDTLNLSNVQRTVKDRKEPISEDLEDAAYNFVMDNYGNPKEPLYKFDQRCFRAGAQWQEQQMMSKAIDAQCFGFQGAALFSFRLPADNYLVGSKIKVIVIKED